ncbi:uncharacterized protein LOC104879882 isoform X1 [Vitis vinifera]|uniref:uncharacterized protein LOC104879882 isoform X1 n=2 Tax=Vitis vinifera TaxID=29760 RepID=UPI00053FC126|nr:uncharacterized protein LOC104879882 isoform X1 [Vitis vinifera]|eukprot:XP_010652599.1 PREDICTED: uncharacterized protein LOC104879882 isoform X1 [Vitis vinifera]
MFCSLSKPKSEKTLTSPSLSLFPHLRPCLSRNFSRLQLTFFLFQFTKSQPFVSYDEACNQGVEDGKGILDHVEDESWANRHCFFLRSSVYGPALSKKDVQSLSQQLDLEIIDHTHTIQSCRSPGPQITISSGFGREFEY